MLRNTHVFRIGVLPARARAATIGLLAFVGLAVAGLRGPTSQAQSSVQGIEGETAQVVGQNGSRARRRRWTFRCFRQKPSCCLLCNRLHYSRSPRSRRSSETCARARSPGFRS